MEANANLMLNLPREIWSIILDLVPQRDRVQQRGVSKQWCQLVDACSTLKINYSSIPEELLEHVLKQRIRMCEFSGLKGPMKHLSQPLLLREITLGPCVTPENTRAILTACSNVEYLRYFVTEKSDVSFGGGESIKCQQKYHADYLHRLRRLKSIELGILFFGQRNSSVASCVQTLFGNKDLIFSGLIEVIIHFKMVNQEWEEFYGFVNRHSKTLRKISLHHQCFCESGSWVLNKSSCSEWTLSTTNNNLTPATDKQNPDNFWFSDDVCLNSIVLMKGTHYKCECNGELLWTKLLNFQKNISVLCTDLIPNATVIRQLVLNCTSQLTSLKLYDIPLGIDACFDFSVFENCKKLRELSLHFLNSEVIVMRVSSSSDGGNGVSKRYAECHGLQLLPRSLTKLSIKGCDIATQTLMEMTGCLPSLQILYLVDPGSPPRNGYGVTFPVLLSIFENLKDLRQFFVDKKFLNFSNQSLQQIHTKTMQQDVCKMFQQLGLINTCDVFNLCGTCGGGENSLFNSTSTRCIHLNTNESNISTNSTPTSSSSDEPVTIMFDLNGHFGSVERSALITKFKGALSMEDSTTTTTEQTESQRI